MYTMIHGYRCEAIVEHTVRLKTVHNDMYHRESLSLPRINAIHFELLLDKDAHITPVLTTDFIDSC